MFHDCPYLISSESNKQKIKKIEDGLKYCVV